MKNTLLLILLISLLPSIALTQTTADIEDVKMETGDAMKRAGDAMKRAAEEMKKAAKIQTVEKENSEPKNENVTYQNFQMIKSGMTFEQVKAILGNPTKKETDIESDTFTKKIYSWDNKSSSIRISFRNSILTSKSQMELTKESSISELTESKYRLIQNGMPYEAIVSILGSDGEMQRMTRIDNVTLVTYKFRGNDNQFIRTNFRNNKLTNVSQNGVLKNINSKLTLAKFSQIELGMSYYEVVQIIGREGHETSSSIVGSDERKSFKWKGNEFVSIRASFRNNKLISKSQSNIGERNGTADLTQEKFNRVNIGMSYYEVLQIIGSDGEMTRLSKIGEIVLTSYTWKGPKYQRIFMAFKDGKLQNKSQSSLN